MGAAAGGVDLVHAARNTRTRNNEEKVSFAVIWPIVYESTRGVRNQKRPGDDTLAQI